MTKLIDFYKNNAAITLLDGNELTLRQILLANDAYWEECHNFIQWVLPNPNPSKYNPDAPLLTLTDAGQLSYDDVMPSIVRFLEFLGLRYVDSIRECEIFSPERVNEWVKGDNHNKLRVTRLMVFINCLKFAWSKNKKLITVETAIMNCLDIIAQYNQIHINSKTYDFWNSGYTVALNWYSLNHREMFNADRS